MFYALLTWELKKEPAFQLIQKNNSFSVKRNILDIILPSSISDCSRNQSTDNFLTPIKGLVSLTCQTQIRIDLTRNTWIELIISFKVALIEILPSASSMRSLIVVTVI